MTTSVNVLSVFSAMDAAANGTVLYDAGIVAGSDAALVEASFENPDALSEVEQTRANMLSGKWNLGRWTTAGEVKLFGNSHAVMATALARLKKPAPVNRNSIGVDLTKDFLHAAGPKEASQSKNGGTTVESVKREVDRGDPKEWFQFLQKGLKGSSFYEEVLSVIRRTDRLLDGGKLLEAAENFETEGKKHEAIVRWLIDGLAAEKIDHNSPMARFYMINSPTAKGLHVAGRGFLNAAMIYEKLGEKAKLAEAHGSFAETCQLAATIFFRGLVLMADSTKMNVGGEEVYAVDGSNMNALIHSFDMVLSSIGIAESKTEEQKALLTELGENEKLANANQRLVEIYELGGKIRHHQARLFLDIPIGSDQIRGGPLSFVEALKSYLNAWKVLEVTKGFYTKANYSVGIKEVESDFERLKQKILKLLLRFENEIPDKEGLFGHYFQEAMPLLEEVEVLFGQDKESLTVKTARSIREKIIALRGSPSLKNPVEKLVDWWRQRKHVPLPFPQFTVAGREEIQAIIQVALRLEQEGERVVAAEIYGSIAVAAARSGKMEMVQELLLMLASVLRDSRELDSAKEVVGLSRELYPAEKNELVEGKRLSLLADIYVREENYGAAVPLYEKAAQIYSRCGEKGLEGRTRGAIGEYYVSEGQHDRALVELTQGLRLLEEAGEQQYAAILRLVIDKVQQGSEKKGEKVTAKLPKRDESSQVRAIEELVGQAREAVRNRHLDEAVDFYREAVGAFEKEGYERLKALVYSELAETYEKMRFLLDAAAAYGRSHYLFKKVGDVQNQDKTLSLRLDAVVNSVGGERMDEQACIRVGEQYERLVKIHQAAGETHWVIGSHMSAALNFKNGGDNERALVNAREVLRMAVENSLQEDELNARWLIEQIQLI